MSTAILLQNIKIIKYLFILYKKEIFNSSTYYDILKIYPNYWELFSISLLFAYCILKKFYQPKYDIIYKDKLINFQGKSHVIKTDYNRFVLIFNMTKIKSYQSLE